MITNKGNKYEPVYLAAQRIIATYSRLRMAVCLFCVYTQPRLIIIRKSMLGCICLK